MAFLKLPSTAAWTEFISANFNHHKPSSIRLVVNITVKLIWQRRFKEFDLFSRLIASNHAWHLFAPLLLQESLSPLFAFVGA
jgi:hypothetical protein